MGIWNSKQIDQYRPIAAASRFNSLGKFIGPRTQSNGSCLPTIKLILFCRSMKEKKKHKVKTIMTIHQNLLMSLMTKMIRLVLTLRCNSRPLAKLPQTKTTSKGINLLLFSLKLKIQTNVKLIVLPLKTSKNNSPLKTCNNNNPRLKTCKNKTKALNILRSQEKDFYQQQSKISVG